MKRKLNMLRLYAALCICFVAQFSFENKLFSQIVINEYSCSNYSSFTDNYGNYEDWIELYNPTSASVSLLNFYLSDKTTDRTKWQFGNVSIPANGYLIIWASEQNVNSGPDLHTNFGLKQCKFNKIILSNTVGGVVDSITIYPAKEAHARGRTTDGASTWSLFLMPTPGSTNTNASLNYTPKPIPTINAGFYVSPQILSFQPTIATTSIHYTIDGSTPTVLSTTYSAPININVTTVVRAIAISSIPNQPSSFIESNSYFINVSHTTPVLSIYGDEVVDLLNSLATNPQTGLEYFDETKTQRAEGYGETNKHGNDSWAYNQRGIDFICRDQFGYSDALQHSFFESKNRNEFQRLIIKAAANDNYPFEGTPGGQLGGIHLRDAYVHTVAQKASMHLDGRTWKPAVLYANGVYWGVYDIREKVDDADYTKQYYKVKKDSLEMLKTWGGTWSEYGGANAQTNWDNLKNFILGNNMTVAANYNYVENQFDLKSLTDYVILHSYCVSSDWLNYNTMWWRGTNTASRNKKWKYALWDEDATFDHYINYTSIPATSANADPCDPETLPDPGDQGHIPILNALLLNNDFKQYYVMRYFDLLNSGLSCQRMTEILDSMVNIISPEMPGQIAKWGGTLTEWQQNVLDLENFIQQRCALVTQQFDNCYNTTGPFTIKVNSNIPGAGTVNVNSLHITNFVWSASYPGNLNILLNADANPNYCFSHWEVFNNTLLSSSTSKSNAINLIANDSIVAHFVANPTPTIIADNATICAGNNSKLLATGGINYSWTPQATLSCNSCPNPIANPTVTTVYTVVSSPSSTCFKSAEFTLSVISNKDIASEEFNLCENNSMELNAGPGNDFIWTPSNFLTCTTCNNPIANPTQTTTYTVTYRTIEGCGKTTNKKIIVLPKNKVFISDSILNPGIPQEVIFTDNTENVKARNWSINNELFTTNRSQNYSFLDEGNYAIMLTVENYFGCKDTLILNYEIVDLEDVKTPNIFSPNDDGVNDTFRPGMKSITKFSCFIFDRWGKEIYEFKNENDSWDGKYKNGKTCEVGVYYFVMSATDRNDKVINERSYFYLVK